MTLHSIHLWFGLISVIFTLLAGSDSRVLLDANGKGNLPLPTSNPSSRLSLVLVEPSEPSLLKWAFVVRAFG